MPARPESFADLSQPNGVGPVRIVNEFYRPVVDAAWAEWKCIDEENRAFEDVLVGFDTGGEPHWELPWKYISQVEQLTDDGHPWQIRVEHEPRSGKSIRTRGA